MLLRPIALLSVVSLLACADQSAENETVQADEQASPEAVVMPEASVSADYSSSELPAELLAAEQELSELELANSLNVQELTLVAPPVLELDPVLALSDAYDENPESYPEFSWLDLVPEDFYFSALLDQVQERFPDVDFAMMDDWDPMAIKALDYLRELTDAAPVREDLDGSKMRIPGFLLPLDFEAQEISSFLLVPYFGACIHTPPPPANQIILVELDQPFRLQQMFEPVWVNGSLSAQSFESELAMAGYRMQAHLVELYDEFDY